MSVLLAGLAALTYGVSDFSGGLAVRRGPLLPVLLISQLAGAVLAALLVLAGGVAMPPWSDQAWGLVAGLAGVLGLAALYLGLARSIVALVAPTAALLGAAIPVLYALLSGERPGATALLGASLCLPAILVLSWERGAPLDRRAVRAALGFAALAGLFIGGFFIALSHTSPGSGLWPVLAARVASIPALLGFALVARRGLAPPRESLAPALLAGLADMAANALFLLSARGGLLSVAVIVSSLYPAPTVLLARVFFKEHVPLLRATGMVLAIAGVALIGMR